MDNATVQEMGALADKAYTPYLKGATFTTDEKRYKVVEVSNTSSGFQGMLVEEVDAQGNGTGKYTFAFRGTEADAPLANWEQFYKDLIIADFAYMGEGTVPQQMKDAMAFVKAQIDLYSLNTSNTVFTGHSLGGAIAGMASYVFGFNAYTYNGFGIANMLWDADDTSSDTNPREIWTDPLTGQVIGDVITTLGEYLEALDVTVLKSTDQIINIVQDGYAASDLVGGLATRIVSGQKGETHFVLNHTGDAGGSIANHSIAPLNQSIAIYNNILKLFPGETYDSLTAALRFLGPDDRKVSRLLTCLTELVSANVFDPDDHVQTSKDIAAVLNYTSALSLSFGLLAVSSSAGVLDTGTTATRIDSLDPTNKAELYSLLRLLPFTIDGDSTLYDQFSELDETYTDQFLDDRKSFLFHLTGATRESENDIVFYDKSLNINILAANFLPIYRWYLFGGETGDPMTGGSQADHLYGMAGNDNLTGGKGDDYLEGGKGNDIYIWNIGDGNDTIVDVREEDDGKQHGTIIIRDNEGEYVAAGSFERKKDGSGGYLNEWVREINEVDIVTLIHGATWQLRMPDDSLLDLGADFQDGDFGISLTEESDPGDLVIVAPGDIDDNFLYQDSTSTGKEIHGLDGKDMLIGGVGNDLLDGGIGDDWIAGQGGADTILGGAGNDLITWIGGGSEIYGGEGDDIISANVREWFFGYVWGSYLTMDAIWADLSQHWQSSYEDGLRRDPDSGYLSVRFSGGVEMTTINGESVLGDSWTYECIFSPGSFDLQYFHPVYAPDGYMPNNYFLEHGMESEPLFTEEVTLFGEGGNDLLVGNGGGDYLYGGADRDFLIGNQGNDFLDGGDGDDVLVGGQGEDILLGGDGIDDMYGETGSDVLLGGDGDDRIWADSDPSSSMLASEDGDDFVDGGAGNDQLVGQGGNDSIYGGTGNDVLYGDDAYSTQYGDDFLDGGEGDDDLIGGMGDDHLLGGTGNDRIWGDNGDQTGDGNDTLYGGDGDDLLQGGGGDDILYGDAGLDNLVGNDGNDTLYGNDDNDILWGVDGKDFLYGGLGNDQLQGGEDNDFLDGGDGDDTLFGQAGDDDLYGGDGDDWLAGEDESSSTSVSTLTGNDIIYGGAGIDILIGGNGTDILFGDEDDDRLYGGNDNDTLYGGDGADSLYGQAGDDELNGGDGDDWLAGEDESNSSAVSSLTGNDTLSGGGGNDVLVGGNGNDTLYGDNGDDRLYGGIGDDFLYGGEGNDFLYGGTGSDILAGGAGDDTYYISRGSGLKHIVDTSDDHNKIVFQGGINLSSISLSLGSLMISSGEPGDELHIDGVDYDNLAATTPIETIEFSDGQIMSVAEVIAAVGIDLPATEEADSITGTSGRDNINALAGDDTVDSRGGDDQLDLGTGNDMAYAGEGNDIILAGDGDDTVYGEAGNDTIYGGTGIDTLYGGDGDDTITGDSGDDILSGGEGADLLSGSVGLDVLYGEAGNDTLHGNEDNDQLYGGADNDILYGDEGDDTLDGEAGADQLFGGDGNDTLYGGAGNDVLTGGLGTDTLVGGLDDDIYIVDSTDDTLTEQVDEGQDLVIASLNYTLETNIENLQLAEESTALIGTGNELDNTLEGNSQNNSLYGLAGADTLVGNAGDDLLDGGVGADTLIGGAGDDQYLVDDVADILIEDAGNGSDTVTATVNYSLADNIENLSLLGAQALIGTGNDLANTLTGNEYNNQLDGQAGNDILYGGAGDDSLIGGLGSDQMIGGTGNDTYVVDNANDIVVELVDEGVDLVESSISTELADNVENLTLIGTSAINATGNIEDNLLLGNSGDNTLSGLAGNDELRGGDGNDRLLGGLGTDLLLGGLANDTYVVDNLEDTLVENYDEGTDTVESSVTYLLGENLENLLLTGAAAVNGTGNELNNHLVGNSANNILDGGTGADILEGGSGDDTYLTADEGDTIIEAVVQGMDTEIRSYETSAALTDNVEYLILSGSVIQGTGNIQGNTITGNNSDNILLGLGGDDTLIGGLGSDHMEGGTGNDIYEVDDIGDVVIELAGGGYDTIRSNLGITLDTYVENAILTGSANVGAIGNEQDNYLEGNSGDNRLEGGAGVDTMIGGSGNDTYLTDVEGDSITEEANQGVDTEIRSYDTLYLLTDNVENLTLAGTAYRGNGNALDNIITGNDVANNLWGLEGDDSLIGNAGDDALFGDEGQDILLGGAGDDYLEGGSGNDSLYGEDGDDQLDGGSGDNFLRGGLGNDTYVYRSDAGVYQIDNSDGGSDWLLFTDDLTADRLSFIKSGDDLIVRVDGDENHQVVIGNWFLGQQYQLYAIQPSGANGITAATINRMFRPDNPEADGIEIPAEIVFDQQLYGTSDGEQLLGTSGNDSLRGYEGNDYLFGQGGDDWLLGGSGDDQLDGGTGNDMLYGGSGNDVYVFRSGYGAETIDNSGGGTDWLLFDTGLTLDTLVFSRVDDNLVIDVDGTDDQVTVLNWFTDTDNRIEYIQPYGGNGISAAQIEALLTEDPPAGDFDTVVEGTTAAEQLVGTSGADQLNAYAGDDQLFGLAGDDELNGGDGNDYLDGGAGNDVQNGGAGADQLGGDAGDDILVGGSDNDIYVYRAGAGADTIINTGGGTDWLIFDDGITSDRLSFIQSEDDLIVRVDENSATQVTVSNWFQGGENQLSYIQPDGESGISAAQINALFTVPPDDGGDEDLLTVPDESTFDMVVTGAATGSQIVGSSGNDLLQGLAGDDQLFGLGGNDWLVAGDGSDYLDGGSGNDTQLGGAGDDQLGGDAGDDVLSGGSGNDIYVYRAGSGNDTIINEGGGTDWLIFTDDITADRLTYVQTGDDLLVNIDDGEAGSVTVLDWFLDSEHQLSYIQPSGGYGIPAASLPIEQASTTSSSESGSVLVLSDFVSGEDVLELSKSVFTSLTDEGTLSSALFCANSTGSAQDDNDYILYNTSSGALLYDADGSGEGAAVQFASLSNKSEISANDFLVVA